MKQRTTLLGAAFCFLTFASGVAFSYGNDESVRSASQPAAFTQRAIDEARAPIKSEADLQQYLLTEKPSSPLNLLSPAGKASFIDSLRFGDQALGSYSYEPLERELSASEIYDILSLFGAQATTRLIDGAAVKNKTDEVIMRTQVASPQLEPIDYEGYACLTPHTCSVSPTSICMHSC